MNKEVIYKNACIVLAALIILMSILQINNVKVWRYQEKIIALELKANNLAVTLSQINALFAVNNPIVPQVNVVLTNNGYGHLVRIVPTVSTAPSLLPPQPVAQPPMDVSDGKVKEDK